MVQKLTELPTYQDYWEDLVHTLIYHHVHRNAKSEKVLIQKRMSVDLDFDEKAELIEECSEHLDFVQTMGEYVWYEQTEPMLQYVKEETDMELWEVGRKFSHLTPPDLRDKYNLPKPKY